ncbi:MAG: hypothetical protein WDM79_11940 [Terricaulis sp.]
MTGGNRIWIGVGMLAALSACATRPNLPPEPDSYVAAGQMTAEQAAALAATPAASWLDDLGAPEMSTLAREALEASPELQSIEARYRASRWRSRGAFGRLAADLGHRRPMARAPKRLQAAARASAQTS